MIKIKENVCAKVPGITSLFISFSYNKEIINLIKNCDVYNFDKKTLDWEVPVNSLSYILDNLTYYDDIELSLMKDVKKEIQEIEPTLEYKLQPYDYQMEGIKYGLNNDRWLLLDAPGLGKTAQIIHIAEELKATRGLKHCFIICGLATLKTNWKREIQTHSDLSCTILGERVTRTGSTVIDSVAKRAEILKEPIEEFFIITNIETLRSDEVIEAFKKGKNEIDMIVVDEIHKCVSKNTILDTNLGKLSIEHVVENKIDCLVKSYNHTTKEIEYRKILNHFENGHKDQLIKLTIEEKGVLYTIECTPDHKIFTHNRGYVCAEDLTNQDNIKINIMGKLISKEIINYESKVYDIEIEHNHNYFANDILVHNCKSNRSQQGKNLLKLKNAKYKIGATGTLLLNNPLDAYVPLAWIGAEKSTLTTFRYFYCEFSNQMTGQVTGVKNMDILKNQMAAVSLRRTKDLLNLPPKNIINEYVDMNEKHRKFYDDIKKGIKKEVDKVKLTTQSVLAMITRLRQATASPSILTTSDITSSKIERTVDLVEQIVSNGDKVVIFSTFKESAYKLKELLLEYNPVLLTGDTKESEVEIIKSRFQTDDSCKVFIGTWQKAGTGITLTAANYMIFIDTPWTYAEFEQSQDRIYRIGTKKSVFIYNLICKDTIDERVKDILYTKKAISDFVIDDKVSDENIDALKKYLLEEL